MAKKKRNYSFRIIIDIGALFSFFVLAASPFIRPIWFFLPVAVAMTLSSRSRLIRLIPAVSFVLGLTSFEAWNEKITVLDALAYVLFYMEGLMLFSIRPRRVSFSVALLTVLFTSFIAALLAYGTSVHLVFAPKSLIDWANAQLESDVFPAFFSAKGWTDTTMGVFSSILLPIFRAGIFAWFAAMMTFAFFISGLLAEYLVRMRSARPFQNPMNFRFGSLNFWHQFNRWKAPDFILIALVAGLALVAYGGYSHSLPIPAALNFGWNLTILALFPIFLQGVALASFVIPRVSFFFMLLIIFLLFVNPVPVLVLAGLIDLWFDFRARIGSNPKT